MDGWRTPRTATPLFAIPDTHTLQTASAKTKRREGESGLWFLRWISTSVTHRSRSRIGWSLPACLHFSSLFALPESAFSDSNPVVVGRFWAADSKLPGEMCVLIPHLSALRCDCTSNNKDSFHVASRTLLLSFSIIIIMQSGDGACLSRCEDSWLLMNVDTFHFGIARLKPIFGSLG